MQSYEAMNMSTWIWNFWDLEEKKPLRDRSRVSAGTRPKASPASSLGSDELDGAAGRRGGGRPGLSRSNLAAGRRGSAGRRLGEAPAAAARFRWRRPATRRRCPRQRRRHGRRDVYGPRGPRLGRAGLVQWRLATWQAARGRGRRQMKCPARRTCPVRARWIFLGFSGGEEDPDSEGSLNRHRGS